MNEIIYQLSLISLTKKNHRISQVFGCLRNPFLTQELFHHYSHAKCHSRVDGTTPSFFESAFDIIAALDYAHRDKSHHSTKVV